MPCRYGVATLSDSFVMLDVATVHDESEDNGSVTSTVDTVNPLACDLDAKSTDFLTNEQQHQNEKTPRRRVVFNEPANLSYNNHQIFEDDIPDLWYQNSDFRRFKSDNKSAAKKVALFEQEFVSDPDSYSNVMQRLLTACNKKAANEFDLLNSNDYRKLKKHVAIHYKRVGMEKLSIYCLLEAKKVRRREVVDTVLIIEEEQCSALQDFSSSADERAQLIANAAYNVTRASSLFATLLAQAYHPQ